ncbi:MAG: flap endonuclease-1 [Nanoarchaeota archaeon]|nr:flap endonuclease-1 [Nanoarchaeota archaeon]
MGLNIREIVSKKECKIKDFKNQTLCVDAFNTIYQFLSTIRQADGSPLMDEKGYITSHLSGILYRTIALLTEGVKLIYVFDGKAPELKGKIHKIRGEARDKAKEKYEAAKDSEDIENMRKYSSQSIRLEDEMIVEAKELLEALGVCVIQAPSEGEAQGAYLASLKKAEGIISQDYDSLIFGTPILIRNLTVSRKRKTSSGYQEIKPEKIILQDLLDELEINRDQLICLAILVGTDYNPKGIFRIGQKKALQIVKEFQTPEKIFKSVEEKIKKMDEKDQFNWKEIFELFKNPEVKVFDIKFPEPTPEKVKELLIKKHGFSQERIQKQLDKLEDIKKQRNQKTIDKWF